MNERINNIKPARRRKRASLMGVIRGDKTWSHYLWEHKGFIAFLMALIIAYMWHDNTVKQTASRQQLLRDTITNLKAEATATATELNWRSSLPEVKNEVQKRNLNLTEATTPAVILKMETDKNE
jgi:hypothetical protein